MRNTIWILRRQKTELKWDKDANTVIRQIGDKNYTCVLQNDQREVVMVGINYDKDSKEHECVIRKK